MVFLSFVIAAYNAEDSIERCVTSISEQPFTDLEIIVVDDGSTDNTLQIASSLSSKEDRISVIHQNNSGVSSARNTGLAACKGDYVFFCDSDDWIEEGSLPIVANELKAKGPDILITDYFRQRENEADRASIFPESFSTMDNEIIHTIQTLILRIQPSSVSTCLFHSTGGLGGAAWHYFFNRKMLQSNDIVFRRELDGLLEDGFFAMEAMEKAALVSYLHYPFYHYRTDNESSTHGYHPDFLERCHRAYDAFLRFGKRTQKPEGYYDALNARVCYFIKKLCAVDYLSDGNPQPASKRYSDFVSAVTTEPFRSALEHTDYSLFSSRLERIHAVLLIKEHYHTYWLLRKAKLKINPIQ